LFFEVDATGGELAYQWFLQGPLIPRAPNNILDFSPNYAVANPCFFSVNVSNPLRQVSSPPPGPCLPGRVLTNRLVVAIFGPAGATNQWFKDGIPLQDDGNISGSQGPTLTIRSADLTDAGTYVLTSSFISTFTNVFQANSTFVVYVIAQPALQNFFSTMRGPDVVFEADATGGLLAYQWYWQGQPIPGATRSTLVFPNAYATASAGYYSLLIANPVGQVSSPLPGILFTKTTPSGTYQGLFFNADTNLITVGSSGFFQYTLSATKRSFS